MILPIGMGECCSHRWELSSKNDPLQSGILLLLGLFSSSFLFDRVHMWSKALPFSQPATSCPFLHSFSECLVAPICPALLHTIVALFLLGATYLHAEWSSDSVLYLCAEGSQFWGTYAVLIAWCFRVCGYWNILSPSWSSISAIALRPMLSDVDQWVPITFLSGLKAFLQCVNLTSPHWPFISIVISMIS